ncbi:MAG TPA: AAA family ATPase [Verrucomicrobiae bacterium]|jgi:tetratricopeptide (TPR) repeat protein
MSLVPHKYTPAEMSDHELEATFAAREHTVDYLLKSLRDQIHSGTLSSYVITGPRGAGKSTIIQMVDLRIRQDAELSAAWTPVVFPEEQFNMISLRDMLAAILQALTKQQISAAQEWLNKVEAEPNDEQSQQLAITGLREIARQIGKRFILFIENLDQLLEQHLDNQMKGTLRRLLMTEPCMMIIGSTVHVFESLKSYDEAFFNYFGQVPLNRLNPEQVTELLRKRAEFDNNEIFLRELPKQQAKVRTLVHLTGGNPRFVLMLYELLSLQKVTSIVQYLRRLVDELTPLLKDEMENLPPQQRKLLHALMEKGGTAQPIDLVGPTRLPLNAINTQLKRLKDAQIVEVLGGGKGHAANYTVPDKLFSIWYQMRYLSQNRRRIELFVEVLRIWFEEEERVQTLRNLADRAYTDAPQMLRECATAAEYFAASLKGTTHEKLATDLCIGSWVKADLQEAVNIFADFTRADAAKHTMDEAAAHTGLAFWLHEHNDSQHAIEALDGILSKPQPDGAKYAQALMLRGLISAQLGNFSKAINDFNSVVQMKNVPKEILKSALFGRGMVKDNLSDTQGAISDISEAIERGSVYGIDVSTALSTRANLKGKLGDLKGEVEDYTAILSLENISKNEISRALINRGIAKSKLGDYEGEIVDYNLVINLDGAPIEGIARALNCRGEAKGKQGDKAGEIADHSAVIELKNVPQNQLGVAFALRGMTKIQLEEWQSAIIDLDAALKLKDIPTEQVAATLLCRGLTKNELKDDTGAISDIEAIIQMKNTPKKILSRALFLRGGLNIEKNPTQSITDWTSVLDFGVGDDPEDFISAAVMAFGLSLGHDNTSAENIMIKFVTALNLLKKERANEIALRFLNNLASGPMKEMWLAGWRSLMKNLNPEITEAVKFLEPVYDVLEGKDRKLLDALPPEQREFVLEVLTKFTPNTQPSKQPKTKRRR